MNIVLWAVAAYLALGAAALAWNRSRPRKENLPDFRKILERAKFPEGPPLSHRLTTVIALGLAIPIALLIWPVAIWYELRPDPASEPVWPPAATEEPRFHATRESLIARMTIGEIEASELVDDPMDAAPRVPFGHLNASWARFKDGVTESDELWSFSSRPPVAECAVRRKRDASGYALVRNGEIVNDFVTAFDLKSPAWS